MGRRRQRHLSAAQFDAVMLLIPTMSAKRRAAARLGLVDGCTAQSIADLYGWGRTAVNNTELIVWRTWERYEAAKKAERRPLRKTGM